MRQRFLGTQNKIYNVMDYGAQGDGKSDDSEAFVSAWNATCGAEEASTLLVPPNGEFMVKGLNFRGPCNATSVNIQVRGRIVAPAMNVWLKGQKTNLISIFNVSSLSIDGSGGSIDGYGSTCPKAHIRVNGCEGATFSNVTIHSPGDSSNTDGIDIFTSKNILIENSTIACGDDCIAISGGSSNINATGIACGPGHGISIGSLGRDQTYETVEEVHVKNCSFTNTTNGARIKTAPGGSGYARNITFENITLVQANNAIIIDQTYGSKYSTNGLSSLNVSDVTFRGFSGTSEKELAITLNCSPPGCFNIVLDHINIVSATPEKPATCSCNNAHGTATYTVPNCSLSS
ncbi:unnamed protein product [Sphenostylis stenocarpa]|uniref:Polygalacturonase n=1 Tax=Sphenostylis stenocarpa TaxID=92480 RepID=A0AA86S9L5_9FABA|nr:unnamed protein product [Sphenostylis stenocarpa]